jgi:GH18 family chitinase
MAKVKAMSLLLFALALFILIPGGEAQASTNAVSVVVDGKAAAMNPQAFIVSGRTVVPLRYLVEDPGYGGQIEWDNAKRQVILHKGDMEMILTIGSKRAVVNGKSATLEVAPFISESRTFVPLRFISEYLGAEVGWLDHERTAVVSFKIHPEVWGYYYKYDGDLQELKDHADSLTDVVFRWLEVDGSGNVQFEYTDNYADILDYSKQAGLNRHHSIVLMDPDQLHTLLMVPENRARFIDNMRQILAQYPAEGINLDLEFIRQADNTGFTALCREMKAAFPDLTVSAAVMSSTGTESWAAGANYPAIGQVLDKVMVMAYDYHWAGGSAGAVAPIDWVEKVMAYAQSCIPDDKLMLGIPAYGYYWPAAGGQGGTMNQAKLSEYSAAGSLLSKGYSASAASPYMNFRKNGVNYVAWYEDINSYTEKWALTLKGQYSGVFFWKIGGAFSTLYDVVGVSSK